MGAWKGALRVLETNARAHTRTRTAARRSLMADRWGLNVLHHSLTPVPRRGHSTPLIIRRRHFRPPYFEPSPGSLSDGLERHGQRATVHATVADGVGR